MNLPDPRVSAMADIACHLQRLKSITPREFETLLDQIAFLVQPTDPELSKRAAMFSYRNFTQAVQIADETWLPSQRDLDDALDMQRSEPRQEAWKRSGDEA